MIKTRAAAAGALAALIFATIAGANEIMVAVPGIPGPYCAYGAEKRLLELDGVVAVTTLWDKELIRITVKDGARISAEQIKQAMRRADYPYKYEIQTGAR